MLDNLSDIERDLDSNRLTKDTDDYYKDKIKLVKTELKNILIESAEDYINSQTLNNIDKDIDVLISKANKDVQGQTVKNDVDVPIS